MHFDQRKHESIVCLRRFLRENDGATTSEMKAAGVSMRWLDYLRKRKVVKGRQVKEPENGPRAYHWRFYEVKQ